MKTLCSCGFDCTDFITQHAIPTSARFSCPTCETVVNVSGEADEQPPTMDGFALNSSASTGAVGAI